MCRYREMILGDDCEEIQLRRIGEILSLSRSLEMVSESDEDLKLSIEKCVPPQTSCLRIVYPKIRSIQITTAIGMIYICSVICYNYGIFKLAKPKKLQTSE